MPAIEKLDRPSEVYDAIARTLKDDLSAAGRTDIEVKDYEDWGPDNSASRCILIEFAEIAEGKKQNDGRHAQDQEIVFYVLVSRAQKRAAREAKNIGSALMRKLIDNRWGIDCKCIEEPRRFSSGSALFTQGEKGQEYEAYEVRFWQLIRYGDSQWPPPVEGPAEIALAINPDYPSDPGEYESLPSLSTGGDSDPNVPTPINSCQAALTIYESLRGGSVGQTIIKKSAADHDYGWGNGQAGAIPDVGDLTLVFENQLI